MFVVVGYYISSVGNYVNDNGEMFIFHVINSMVAKMLSCAKCCYWFRIYAFLHNEMKSLINHFTGNYDFLQATTATQYPNHMHEGYLVHLSKIGNERNVARTRYGVNDYTKYF